MNIAIIYHDADFDGKLSNEVCRHWLAKLHPEARVFSYGWDYGRPVSDGFLSNDGRIPWHDFDQIYIVDLSVNELMARPELCNKIIWIDHHASAIKQWMGENFRAPGFKGYRIDGVAACRLCWQWFLDLNAKALPEKQDFIDRNVFEPKLIRLAGEYDIWDHRDADAKTLQFGLRALKEADWRELIDQQFETRKATSKIDLLKSALDWGYMIKLYCDKQNDEYSAAYSHTIQFAGLTMLALNIGQRGNSDLLRGGIKPEHQAGFAWRWDGKQAYCSLYHLPGHEDLDLSVIAKAWGGGGHKGACGFRIDLLQLYDIFCGKHEGSFSGVNPSVSPEHKCKGLNA